MAAKTGTTGMILRLQIALIFFLTSAQFLQGQVNSPQLWRAPYNQDRFIIGICQDSWYDAPTELEMRIPSIGVNSYIMHGYGLNKSRSLSFAWGYGFSSHNVHFNGNLVEDSLGYTQFEQFPENYEYTKHKISMTYIEMPVQFRIRSTGNNQVKLYLGGRIGYLVNVHTKTIDDAGKRKIYGLANKQNIRYGLTASLGVNMISISAFYSLTNIIRDNEGVPLRPLSLGITFYLL